MPAITITDFKVGMSRAGSITALPAGTCWTIKNAHIDRSGRIERTKRWVSYATLPAGTHGLWASKRQLVTFGGGPEPGGMPPTVRYQRLQHPADHEMTEVLSCTDFGGSIYAIARYADGSVFHFYNGARVTDWDSVSSTATFGTLTTSLAARIEDTSGLRAVAIGQDVDIIGNPGEAFSVSAGTTNITGVGDQAATITLLQAAQSAVAQKSAVASIVVGGGGIGGVASIVVSGAPILDNPVAWRGSAAATAVEIAAQINLSHAGYAADATGNNVLVHAPIADGATANGRTMVVATTGALSVSGVATFAGGINDMEAIPQITRVTLSGTFEAPEAWWVTVDGITAIVTGTASVAGTFVATHNDKVYAIAGPLVRFSAIGDPTHWTSGTGSGLLEVAKAADGIDLLEGISPYQQDLAFFSEAAIQVYSIAADPLSNQSLYSIRNPRAIGPRAIKQIGNIDTLFLSRGGVRSIRARQATDAPVVQDVGSAVDPFLVEHMRGVSRGVLARAVSVVEPIDGRYLLAVGDRIFAFSYFPAGKISAWSYYEPGFTVDEFAVIESGLFARAGDTVYLYGGRSGEEYPLEGVTPVEVRLPFTNGGNPSRDKTVVAIEGLLDGEWTVRAYMDPNDPTAVSSDVTIAGTTYPGSPARLSTTSTHVSLLLECRSAGKAGIHELTLGFGDGR